MLNLVFEGIMKLSLTLVPLDCETGNLRIKRVNEKAKSLKVSLLKNSSLEMVEIEELGTEKWGWVYLSCELVGAPAKYVDTFDVDDDKTLSKIFDEFNEMN